MTADPNESRAKEVFGSALDLSPAERPAFLNSACAGDPALRRRVEALLAAAGEDDAFLSTPTIVRTGMSGFGPVLDSPAPITEKPGSLLGPYRIIELLGEGGFGSVFLAEQEKPVKRRVAIKIIKLGMDTRAVVQRFEQERQALAVMDHPNIAKVFDAGATPTGRPYFVMEYVEGESITMFCDDQRVDIPGRIGLFVQVCSAVQHAHTKGVIHRDIKPANVLVSRTERGPVVKVIDFGIAKAMDRTLTDRSIFTEQRTMVGTPEYMSPEQAAGMGDIDTRTDVYSLGVLLYELLTGSPPFDARALRSAAYDQVQRIIREVEPPRPSTRLSSAATVASIAAQRSIAPARLTTLLKGELDWIIMHALDKERARRYESPSALSADLGRYLSGQAVAAAPPSRLYQAKKFVRRHRLPVGAAVLIVLALAAGTLGTTLGLIEARAQARRADAEAVKATENAQRADREAALAKDSAAAADSVSGLMQTMIERADRGKEGGRADITVREVMDAAAREVLSGPDAFEPLVMQRLAQTIGGTYRELSMLDAAEPMLQAALDHARTLNGERSHEYITALNDLAQVHKSMGRLDQAEKEYDAALALARTIPELLGPEAARVRINQAALLGERGKAAEAESLLRQTRADLEAANQKDSDEYALVVQNLAATVFNQGNADAAEALYREWLGLRKRSGRSPDQLTVTHNMAALHMARNQNDEMMAAVREELRLARTLYGDQNMHVADALDSLATALARTGQTDEAIAARKQSLDMQRGLLSADSPQVANVISGLGTLYFMAGRMDEARAAYAEAAPLLEKAVGAGNSEAVFANYRVGLLTLRAGNPDEAEKPLRSAVNSARTAIADGTKYEWMKHAAEAALGDVLLAQAAAQPAQKTARVEEARELIITGAEGVIALSTKMGPKTRASVIPPAANAAVHLYEALGEQASVEKWKKIAADAVR